MAILLMCAAVTEAFAALRRAGVTGLPRNLAVLHSPRLTAVAVRYWARTMRSSAAHRESTQNTCSVCPQSRREQQKVIGSRPNEDRSPYAPRRQPTIGQPGQPVMAPAGQGGLS
jgi:hypothetical protein